MIYHSPSGCERGANLITLHVELGLARVDAVLRQRGTKVVHGERRLGLVLRSTI